MSELLYDLDMSRVSSLTSSGTIMRVTFMSYLNLMVSASSPMIRVNSCTRLQVSQSFPKEVRRY